MEAIDQTRLTHQTFGKVVPLARPDLFPRHLLLATGDADLQVTLRLMVAADRDRMLRFARSLEPDDLLFLRSDITKPEVIDAWIALIETARRVTLLAEVGGEGEIAGYASLHRRYLAWSRHLAELRVLVAPDRRRVGLGATLTGAAAEIAQSMGVRKLVGHLVRTQGVPAAALRRFGFHQEAMLTDWVVDREGRSQDLLVLSRDLEGERSAKNRSPADQPAVEENNA